jgi:glycine dehydrogenase subunit 2
VPESELPGEDLLRDDLILPQVSEGELVRYFVYLSQLNFAIDTGFYPLGSCTMKHNPKWHEEVVRLAGFAQAHPLQPVTAAQGSLQLMCELQGLLSEITGLAATSLSPAAGAHGELAGMLIIRAYHAKRGDEARRKVLVPDSAHGTNPASANMAGFEVLTVKSNSRGDMDMDDLRSAMSSDVAGLMLTLPTTLGLFDPNIIEVCRIVHDGGGLVYGDGANMNALLGQARFGDMGFDVVHLNLHKTFSTPHGGGGPGAGPVCVTEELASFLPDPVVEQSDDGSFRLVRPADSIGAIGGFHGNFGVLIKAYAYIRSLGEDGLRAVSENAVLNANYLMSRLKDTYELPYDRSCMHEAVFSASRQRQNGVRAADIAKRLIDYGFHPPTMYFPLVVDEALMIEPTETESKETIDAFIAALKEIAREAEGEPEVVKTAPHNAPMRRMDEATAARRPDLRWRPPD